MYEHEQTMNNTFLKQWINYSFPLKQNIPLCVEEITCLMLQYTLVTFEANRNT